MRVIVQVALVTSSIWVPVASAASTNMLTGSDDMGTVHLTDGSTAHSGCQPS
jgi:hypothetical protein